MATVSRLLRLLLKWFAKLFLLCFILFVVAVAVVICKPSIISGLIGSYFQKQGVELQITKLEPQWQQSLYYLDSEVMFSDNKGQTGEQTQEQGQERAQEQKHIRERAKATSHIVVNFSNIFSEKSIFTDIDIGIENATIDIEDIKKLQQNMPLLHRNDQQEKNISSIIKSIHNLPKNWNVACKNCSVLGYDRQIAGDMAAYSENGFIKGIVIDSQKGELSINYDISTAELVVDSQYLELLNNNDEVVRFSEFNTVVNFSDIWESYATANISYRGVNSQIKIVGNGKDNISLEMLTLDSLFTLQAQRQGREIVFTTNRFDADILNVIKPIITPIFSNSVDVSLQNKINNFNLSGTLQARFTLQSQNFQKINRYQITELQASLQDIYLSDNTNQFSGISGDIRYKEKVINFNLQLQESVFNLPVIFDRKIPIQQAEINGSVDVGKKWLSFKKIAVRGKNFESLQTAGGLGFTGKKDELIIDLSGSLDNFEISTLSHYLPKKFPHKVGKWLGDAFVSGKNNKTDFVLKGNILKFIKDDNFIFTFTTVLNDGVFHYLKDSPDIAIDSATVVMNRHKIDIAVNKGSIFTVAKGKRVATSLSATGVINDVRKPKLDLQVLLQPQHIKNMLTIAHRSKVLTKIIDKVNMIAKIDGIFSGNLKLFLNLKNKKDYDVDLKLKSSSASALLKQYPQLHLTKANVQTHITHKGLQQLDIQGRYQGRPITINVTRGKKKAVQTVRGGNYRIEAKVQNNDIITTLRDVNIVSEAQVALLKKYNVIGGNSDASIFVHLRENGDLIEVKGNSNLRNTTLNVFGTVIKGKGTTLPVTFSYQKDSGKLNITGDRRFRVAGVLDSNQSIVGLLVDNQKTPYSYQAGKIGIFWQGDKIELDKFHQFYKQWSSISTSKRNAKKFNYQFDVNIKKCKIANASGVLKISGKGNKFSIDSPVLNGVLNYRNNYVQATIKKLALDNLLTLIRKYEVNEFGRKVTKFDLSDELPAMDVTVDTIVFKGNRVGRADIHTSIKKNRYSIDQFFIEGKDYYFDISGAEQMTKKGIVTNVHFDFKAEKLQNIIRLFKLNNVVDAQFLDLGINLSWPGKTYKLDLQHSYGSVDIDAKGVKLLDYSTGVGGIFGLMDVLGILNRVAKDFTNINSSKVFFDSVKGRWNINNGIMSTEDAYATGSVIGLKLIGDIDLKKRVFNKTKLTLIPKASNVFPVIGAVAGGVIGGAVGWVAQQVVGNEVNKSMGFSYDISESWEKPVITTQAFN